MTSKFDQARLSIGITPVPNIALIVLAITLILLLAGCATPANKASMTVTSADQIGTNKSLFGKFVIGKVVGGKETNPLWTSQVSNEEFRSALEDSLRNIGYLSLSASGETFIVDVNFRKLDQPLFGLTFDVSSDVIYRIESHGYTSIFPVISVGTATPSDAFVGVERLKIANERSIKNNIRDFIKKLESDGAISSRLNKAPSSSMIKGVDVPVSKKCLELGFQTGTAGHDACVNKLSIR